MSHRRPIAVACAVAALLLGASHGALAQGASGTAIGAPDPGRFAVSVDLGLLGVQMPRLRFGDVYSAPALGAPSVGSIFDQRERTGGFAPSGGVGWGIPGGLFGVPAEAFGQFGYGRATESGVDGGSTLTFASIPFVNTLSLGSLALTGVGFGLVAGVSQVSFERTWTSYDGQAGVRAHIRRGAWSFSPGVYVGFQRTDLDETMIASAISSSSTFNTAGSISSDFYQLGLAFGATYGLSQQVALFAVVQGGLDYVRARYDGTTLINDPGSPITVTASDRDNRVSGRVGLRGGLAFSPTPAVTITLAGLAQYVGNVPTVVYPSNPVLNSIALAGGTVPAHLATQGQLNFGGAIGATLRF